MMVSRPCNMIPGSRPRRLATMSHKLPTLLTAVLILSVMAAGTQYTTSARTTQKTLISTVTPFLHVTQPLHSNGCFYCFTVLVSCKYTTVLAASLNISRRNKSQSGGKCTRNVSGQKLMEYPPLPSDFDIGHV
jgi:hypothetical protein